jgi:hypothetical protein
MIALSMKPTVIIHIHSSNGDASYYAHGDVRLLIVDENAPDDRVYEWKSRVPEAIINSILETKL